MMDVGRLYGKICRFLFEIFFLGLFGMLRLLGSNIWNFLFLVLIFVNLCLVNWKFLSIVCCCFEKSICGLLLKLDLVFLIILW